MKKKNMLKDPNEPKTPPNSFLLFTEELKKTSKEKYHPFFISRDAAEKWNSMSVAQKAPYVAKAKELMAEHKKNMQTYKDSQKIMQDTTDDDLEEEMSLNFKILSSQRKRKSSPPPPSTPSKKACSSSTEGPTHEVNQLVVAERFLKFKEAIIQDYLASKEFDELKTECADKAIQDYKGSEDYRKDLAENLEMHKKSENYKKELAEHLERYKKSEEYKKSVTGHLVKYMEMHKKSEKYKKELTEHLERYKKSEEYKKVLADEVEKYKASKEHKNIAVQEVVGSFIQGLPGAHRRVYDLLRNRFPELDIGSCSLFPAENSSEGRKIGEEIKFLLLLLPFLLPVVFGQNEDDDDKDTINLRNLLTTKKI